MSEKTAARTDSFSFVSSELEILEFWKKNKIFEKSLKQTEKGKSYVFYDGPPFATGLPHHGHLLASVLKDIVPRYFTMKGRYVQRRWGWDCHGLPIEYEIDKSLGMSTAEAVKKLGVKGYNDECRGIVQRYTKEWKKTISRLGRWVDFENDYKTMDPSFMESVWWVFKQLWDKNLIYKGTKVVPFSTALGTGLSNFEASSAYQDVQDPAITVLFKLKDEDVYISAWTTTPWTLPSNLGLCVGEDIVYVKVLDKERKIKLIVAKDRLEAVFKKREFEVLDQFTGDKLKGKRYLPMFPYFEEFEKSGAFQIFTDDYVTVDNGTGIVHTAPSFGEDDSRIFKEAGIDISACPIDDAGKFTQEVTDFAGMYVKDADKKIIKFLKENERLYDQSVIVHSYPFCPRSDTPLIYKSIPSWYVRVEEFKDRLLESNSKINWIPGHLKDGRFGNWLKGARDWSISRNRVWGTPLPIWINDETGNMICMGSFADIEKYSGKKVTDLHRENVDGLTFSVDGENGIYRRITDVLDCWFESGSMPYAQLHYPFENKEIFEKRFPAEYVAEGLDQTRGWFYTSTVLSTALFDRPTFKNVIVNGMIMAEDGKKMSKRLKNYTAPDDLMEKYGADALRLYLINSGLVRGEEQRFADLGVKDMVRRVLLPWYNSFKFLVTYAEVDGWNADQHFELGDNIVDRWVLSNLQTLKKNMIHEMEGYRLYNVVPTLFNFIEDLTNWYIRLNRARFWGEGLSQDKRNAYSTLYTAIMELNTLMAPFAPFLSEYIYREMGKFGKNEKESVHLCHYPDLNDEMINPILEDAVSRMQQVILLGRQKRNQVQIKVKTPLSRLTIVHKEKDLLDEISKLEGYVRTELNIKTIEYSQNETKFIKFYAKPNSPVLGKRLGRNFGKYRNLIQNLTAKQLEKLELVGNIELDGELFSQDDILVFREAKEGTEAVSNRYISIDMDCNPSSELIEEGLAREIVNRIQKLRKELNFNVSDRIKIGFTGDQRLEDAITRHSEYICRETLATSLERCKLVSDFFEYDIEKSKIKFKISR